MAFTYRPLNATTNDIRLVTILPRYPPSPPNTITSPNIEGDIIRCKIEHYSLEQSLTSRHSLPVPKSLLEWTVASDDVLRERRSSPCETYVALSYTWGLSANTTSIMVDDCPVLVQKNLESALRALREKMPIKAGCKVWIDALCINQADINERNQQVKRMRSIYRMAENILVWLGVAGNDSDLAMQLIRQLSSSYSTGKDEDLAAKLDEHPDHLGSGVWRALSQLFERPYWTRVWVIQELAVGRDDTPILCGSQIVTWRDLYRAVYHFGGAKNNVIFSLIDQERRAIGLKPFGLNRNRIIHTNIEQTVQQNQTAPQYMCLLDLVRKSNSADPRDKVYGILGLMDPEVSADVCIDYNRSVDEVFTSFAKTMITISTLLHLKLFPLRNLRRSEATSHRTLRP